jgi:hypothetical protein
MYTDQSAPTGSSPALTPQIDEHAAREHAYELQAILSARHVPSQLARLITALDAARLDGQPARALSNAYVGSLCRGDAEKTDDAERTYETDRQWATRRVKQNKAARASGICLLRVTPGSRELDIHTGEVIACQPSIWSLAELDAERKKVQAIAQADARYQRGGKARQAAVSAAAAAVAREVKPDPGKEKAKAGVDRLMAILRGYRPTIERACQDQGIDFAKALEAAREVFSAAPASEEVIQFDTPPPPTKVRNYTIDRSSQYPSSSSQGIDSELPGSVPPTVREADELPVEVEAITVPADINVEVDELPGNAWVVGDLVDELPESGSKGKALHSPLTVQMFASSLLLPVTALASCGIGMRKDAYGTEYVAVPFFDEHGDEVAHKQRVKLGKGKPKYIWIESKASLYGLQWLSEARGKPAMFIDEGETDQIVFTHHGLPALGISGASNYTAIALHHMAGIPNVYICRDTDEAGDEFAHNLARHLRAIGFRGGIRVLDFEHERVKDAAELHRKMHGDRTKFRKAVGRAIELSLPE